MDDVGIALHCAEDFTDKKRGECRGEKGSKGASHCILVEKKDIGRCYNM